VIDPTSLFSTQLHAKLESVSAVVPNRGRECGATSHSFTNAGLYTAGCNCLKISATGVAKFFTDLQPAVLGVADDIIVR
jgi:hypothetical protein